MIFRYCRGADYYDNILQISVMKIFFYTKKQYFYGIGGSSREQRYNKYF